MISLNQAKWWDGNFASRSHGHVVTGARPKQNVHGCHCPADMVVRVCRVIGLTKGFLPCFEP